MSVHDEMMEIFLNLNRFFVDALREILNENKKGIESLDCVNEDIETFKKTGTLIPSFEIIPSESPLSPVEPMHGNNSKPLTVLEENNESGGSLKENITSDPYTMEEATSSKSLEQHDSINNTKQVIIKTEKKSVLDIHFNNELNNSNVEIKKEMPPPAKLPAQNVRQKKEKSNLKIKKEKLDQIKNASVIRDSDVQIQKDAFPLVVLDDFGEELQSARCTRARTKARQKEKNTETDSERNHSENPTQTAVQRSNQNDNNKNEHYNLQNENGIAEECVNKGNITNNIKISNDLQKQKRLRNYSSTEDELQSRKQKSRKVKSKNDIDKVSQEMKENFINTPTSTPIVKEPQKLVNETLILNKPTILNRTIVIEKALESDLNRINILEQPGTYKKNDNNSISDDDDVVADSPSRKQRKVKQMFSPYESSPVKKRVQAFEKLVAVGNFKVSSKTIKPSKPREKELTRNITPSTQKFETIHNTTPLTKTRLRCFHKISTSQMELRERELRRKQKEADALQKKEAMIHTQTEEKRKKREERKLKVQQVKMTLERDKQKNLELAERAKNDKIKQMLAEKETKLLKQKEELNKKHIAAAKKTAETKQERKKEIPIFLKCEAPLLPTEDCYDSDNSFSGQQVKQKWEKESASAPILRCMKYLLPLEKKFFLTGPKSPNLISIFPAIEPAKLKRTSSAIWNKTEMSILVNFTNDEEEDEDESDEIE